MGDRMSPMQVDKARAMAALQARGWTTQEIANRSGLSPGHVRNMLTALRKLDPTIPYRRRPSPPPVRVIAQATSAARNPRTAARNANWAQRRAAGESLRSIALSADTSENTVTAAVRRHKLAQLLRQGILNQ